MNRKQRRAAEVARKKAISKAKSAESAVEEKMTLFEHLPDQCMTCAAPFDKNDRDMVMSWHVAVRESEKKVNLYCPSCWKKAIEIVESMQHRLFGQEE